MNMTIKSAIAACCFIATVSAPLTASAETLVFSGKGAFGYMESYNSNLYVSVYASQDAAKGNYFPKTSTSGAYFSGVYDSEANYCYGYGIATSIAFKATNAPIIPKTVTASGTIPVSWSCSEDSAWSGGLDFVLFNINLSATRDEASHWWRTEHQDNGTLSKVNLHFDDSYASASLNDSSITTKFGPVTLTSGAVGNSKSHQAEIVK